jgi:hypothetical protein
MSPPKAVAVFTGLLNKALRVLGENAVGTLQVIAKDVKIRLEINADVVARYRLIGYVELVAAAKSLWR